MTATLIRQKLHNYLELADEKKIKAFYTMMEEEIEGILVEYTPGLKKELDMRYEDYQSGKVKMISSTESKKRIGKILKAKLKK